MSWFDTLKALLPGVATAVTGPLGGAVVKVMADKLGVSDNVEAVAQHLVDNPADVEKVREIELELARLSQKNTDGARIMQEAALQQADIFSKRFVYYLSAFWSLFAVVYILWITFASIPEENVRFADTILGFLLGTVVSTIINFFLGSSASTQKATK
jgi:hypothetical protein